MSILKHVINYINRIPIQEVIELDELVYDLSQPPLCLNKKYKYFHFMVRTYMIKLSNLGVIIYRMQSLYHDEETMRYDYYVKIKNIEFSEYLTVKELNKMTRNKNYIKTFERKCKIKQLWK